MHLKMRQQNQIVRCWNFF